MQHIGRYEILRELGRGAMGVVYAATDPLIGREVAVKTIRLDSLGDQADRAELTRRLFREAQSAGILSHPGIITIYDVGESGSDAYIVMEFVAGKTLEEVLASGTPQPSATFLSILRQTGKALDYAHRKGIVHRDIKPSNIMISENGTVKIADFGIAKPTTSTSLTQAGFVLGTPSYMSPEQAQGREIDGRSDQFSLAVVAFRMMTGKLPFEGPTMTALLAKILWGEPEYESSGLLPWLKPVFEKAFAKNPQLRFTDCTDFVRDLNSGYARLKAELQGKTAPPSDQIPAPTIPPIVETPPPGEQTASAPIPIEVPEKKRERRPVWIALPILVILAFAAVFFVKMPQKTTIPRTPLSTKPVDVAPVPPSEPAKPGKETKPEVPKTAAVPDNRSISRSAVQPVRPTSGTFTWSGDFPKNSILVIDGQNASFGTVKGEPLPDKPVVIEVEPKEIVIRQLPAEANGWRQVMLYSGQSKYSEITVHWEVQRN
jgi:serine/threonine protein kinase